MRRALATIAGLAVASLALVGCTGLPGPAQTPDTTSQVDVFTSWSSGAGKLGLDSLVKVFARQYPRVAFVDVAASSGAGSNPAAALAALLQADKPPDSFQAPAGAGLGDYVAAGRLQDLSTFYSDSGLDDVLPASLLARLTVGGSIYSVPVAIHRVNMVWASAALLHKAGIDPRAAPADLNAWLADLARLKHSGVTAPLAVAAAGGQVQLFENVLLAVLGPSDYQALWNGSIGFDTPAVARAIDYYGRLLAFTAPAGAEQDWRAAVDLLIAGDAAYTVTGDWAPIEFTASGQTYDSDYTAWPTPGTAGAFDFSADSFTLPVGAAHPDAALQWLHTVSSDAGQKVLTLLTSSIPARTDVAPDDYPLYQQGAIAAFAADPIVSSLAYGAAVPTSWLTDITTALGQYVTTRDAEVLQAALVQAQQSGLGR
ncbi:extracellular solute-binding protein [Microbacterium kribbense]|uniref:Probable sugar-binding periplasmic protein n=1 Tax=Microbacterium kribbense TaxID=433645 RepID=A0ABP7G8A1_9MICO